MLKSSLQQGFAATGIEYQDIQIDQLVIYLELLKKWNKKFNLTAITGLQEMVAYHVLDSVSIMPQIPSQGVCLDVGTGAGLPGIPLAIMLPASRWVLLDSNGKKTRFVQQAVASCGLTNVKVVHSRIQDYHADSSFDVIVSRAYSSLADFVTSVEALWQPQTRLVTMKTAMSELEKQSLDAALYELQIKPLQIPGIAEKRSLVSIQRQEI